VEGKFEARLEANSVPVDLNAFTEQFIARAVAGAVSSLRGAETFNSVDLSLKEGNVTVVVDGQELDVTFFPNEIIASTVAGMVSPLKGVEATDPITISVKVS
jgi:hypothetical protein